MPPAARDQGFQLTPVTYESHGEFTAVSGPKKQHENLTPLGALREFFTDPLMHSLSLIAAGTAVSCAWDVDITENACWKYVAAVIGHGIVQYPDEKLPYRAPKAALSTLLSNHFLRDLHTLEQWQHTKEVFAFDRDLMTQVFNNRARDLWTPTKYDFFLISFLLMPPVHH